MRSRHRTLTETSHVTGSVSEGPSTGPRAGDTGRRVQPQERVGAFALWGSLGSPVSSGHQCVEHSGRLELACTLKGPHPPIHGCCKSIPKRQMFSSPEGHGPNTQESASQRGTSFSLKWGPLAGPSGQHSRHMGVWGLWPPATFLTPGSSGGSAEARSCRQLQGLSSFSCWHFEWFFEGREERAEEEKMLGLKPCL